MALPQTDIFISYSMTPDSNLAKKIKCFLEDEFGFTITFPEEHIGIDSDEWRKDIISKIKKSKCFIPIITRNSMHSPWIMYESGAADLNGMPFFILTTLKDKQPELIGYPRSDKFYYHICEKSELEKFIDAIYLKLHSRHISAKQKTSYQKNNLFTEILQAARQKKIFIGGSYPDTSYQKVIKIENKNRKKDHRKDMSSVVRDITLELLQKGYMIASCPDVKYVGQTVAKTVLEWCKETDEKWQDHYEISGHIYYFHNELKNENGDLLMKMVKDGFRASRREYLKEQDVVIFIGGNNRTFIEYEVAKELSNVKICAIPFFGGSALEIFKDQKNKEKLPVEEGNITWGTKVLSKIMKFIDI